MPPVDNNETRKLQFTGRSTFIISLPKKWMAEMQLRVGDPVTIIRGMNSSLSVFPNIMRTSLTEECYLRSRWEGRREYCETQSNIYVFTWLQYYTHKA